MDEERRLPAEPASEREVRAFLDEVGRIRSRDRETAAGRLMFALDATGSRQPTWDRATQIQGEMFMATRDLGGLAVQLCFYRGFGEFKVAPWSSRAADVVRLMTSVACRAGQTQIGKVLQHAINETQQQRVTALVFVGDCMEENVDRLAHQAGQLGMLKVPAFMFHEGGDTAAAFAFKEIARLSGGAYCPFDASSPSQLRDLLRAVAVYAAGGRKALQQLAARQGGEVRLLAGQVRGS
ncbi:MAG: VWA domain-containing protein [Rhodospirillales bacterium]